jgi:hypothetical protein
MLDDKTQKYFESIRNNMGYIGSNAGWNSFKDIAEKKDIRDYSLVQVYKSPYFGIDVGDIEIYQYNKDGETKFCAEFGYRTAIDDYCIETHIFNQFPSLKNIILLRKIDNLEMEFKYNHFNPIIKCWECGCESHWLDFEGTVDEKINALEENYCGC